jgi:hypothetical protein
MNTWRLLGTVVLKKVRSLIPATTIKYGIVIIAVTYYARGTSRKARLKHAFDSHSPASSWYRTVNQPLL